MTRLAKQLTKLRDKEYRDEFLASNVRGTLAYQIQALRKKSGLSQTKFARKVGKKQSQVSEWENAEGEQLSVQTLIDIATALDVGLIVRFAAYPEVLACSDRRSDSELAVPSIDESVAETRRTSREGRKPKPPLRHGGHPIASDRTDRA